jgi:hypothetical protein
MPSYTHPHLHPIHISLPCPDNSKSPEPLMFSLLLLFLLPPLLEQSAL